MGVGGLSKMQKQEEEQEYVEVDVACVIPNFLDHAYLLADGEAYFLDKLTESIPGGIGLKKEFSLTKQGESRQVRLIYAIPESVRHLAFQFFDYSYGHILIPIQGDLQVATGTGKIRPLFLAKLKMIFSNWQQQTLIFDQNMKIKKRQKPGIMPSSSSAARVCRPAVEKKILFQLIPERTFGYRQKKVIFTIARAA